MHICSDQAESCLNPNDCEYNMNFFDQACQLGNICSYVTAIINKARNMPEIEMKRANPERPAASRSSKPRMSISYYGRTTIMTHMGQFPSEPGSSRRLQSSTLRQSRRRFGCYGIL